LFSFKYQSVKVELKVMQSDYLSLMFHGGVVPCAAPDILSRQQALDRETATGMSTKTKKALTAKN